MQLFELEVSNYKCLNNYGMPLIFKNLNVLIGENDSGKTSMLEILQILFDAKEIEKSMFFDLNQDIKIKANFNKNGNWILESAMTIAEIDIDSRSYYKNIREMEHKDFINEDFHNAYMNMQKYNLFDYIDCLKDYSFYIDLKNFFSRYKRNYLVTLEKIIYKNKLSKKSFAYFNLDSGIKECVNILCSNKDFLVFMNDSISVFDDFCNEVADLYFNIEDNIEVEKKFDIPENELMSTSYLNFCRFKYCSIFFTDDSEKLKLAKIAKLISVFINRRNCENVFWDVGASLNIGSLIINNEYLDNVENDDILKDKQNKNILGHSLGKLKSKEIITTLPLPKLYFYNSDDKNEFIIKSIFKDLFYNFFSNEVFNSEFHEFLENSIKSYINKKIEQIGKKDDIYSINETIRAVLSYLKLQSENITDLRFDFTLSKINKIDRVFEEGLDIVLSEKNRLVNISQKGQGFLRKLLLANFLVLTQKPTRIEAMANLLNMIFNERESFTEKINNNRILLIEEPELHLHSNAQRKIMSVIKENLDKNNNQVFITTHSHFIIENSDFENIHVFTKNKESGISNINNITQLGGYKIFNKLKKSLGIKTTDLLFLKKVILIVEGENDIDFIKGLCRNPMVNINCEEILFIDAKGQSNIDYFIGLGALLKIRVLVIFDKNISNTNKKDDLLKRMLSDNHFNEKIKNSILEINVLDKPDILNYLYPESGFIEKYLNLAEGSLRQSNKKEFFKNIWREKKGYIKNSDIEFFASKLKFIEKDLITKIIEPIKRFPPSKII